MSGPDWRQLPSLSALRAFEATARLGGFSAAARSLNVTHAAVAQQVRALEADLGLALAVRDGRGLALTPEGTRLAQTLGDGFAAIADGIAALRAGEHGRGVRVTLTAAFAQSVLLPRLGAFWARHPEVPVSLNPSYVVADLRRDGFDVAIRSGRGPWPGLDCRLVADTRMCLVATPVLLARDPDLGKLPWLLSHGDAIETGWLRSAGLDPNRLTVNDIENPALAVAAALQGYGLLFATEVVVQADLAAGRLTEVPFPGLPRIAYWAVTLPGPKRPAVGLFVDWLTALFPAGAGRPPG